MMVLVHVFLNGTLDDIDFSVLFFLIIPKIVLVSYFG